MKKSILLTLIAFILSVSLALAGNPYIKPLKVEAQGPRFSFAVFGDTRTSELGTPDGHDVVFQLARDQVFKAVSQTVTDGGAAFSLFTGDLIWQGGVTEYWESPARAFSSQVRARIYPIPGNHETWKDADLDHYFEFFPHLKNNHSYYFTQGNSLFLSLCTGGYLGEYSEAASFKQDQEVTCIKAGYTDWDLPGFLNERSQEMAAAGTPLKNIFVQYHKPSFSHYKHPPLNRENDPVEALKAFRGQAPQVQMYVFNGHNHTTELYQPARGITVLVAGGGGAPQKVLSQDLPSKKVMKIYKKKGVKEIFWTSLGTTTEDRTQRVNYWMVEVDHTLNRVRLEEKVLTYDASGPVFVKGLAVENGRVMVEEQRVALP